MKKWGTNFCCSMKNAIPVVLVRSFMTALPIHQSNMNSEFRSANVS